MFIGGGFFGYLFFLVVAFLIQRAILKNPANASMSSTLLVVLWFPVANVIVSAIFYFARNNQIDDNWIRKNIYQLDKNS